jgi:hypothetical protein
MAIVVAITRSLLRAGKLSSGWKKYDLKYADRVKVQSYLHNSCEF